MNSKALIKKLEQKESLSIEESSYLAGQMMEAELKVEDTAKILIYLKEKGETADEIIGFADAMRSKSLYINADEAVDNCGTGGSGLGRINTSTIAAFIVAAAGVKVAKHGNKAASGRCGSFDLLEAAGVKIDLTLKQLQTCFNETGLAFLFAPIFHPAMKAVAPARKKLGVPTIFNILGPLTNPAKVKKQVIGISNAKFAPSILAALKHFGTEHALIVRGDYGLDELSVTGPTQVWELKNSTVKEYIIKPADFAIEQCKMAYIKGGDITYNKRVLFSVLENKDREFRTEQVLINAAAALYVAGKVTSILDGYKLAKEVLTSKKALEKFFQYKELSNTF